MKKLVLLILAAGFAYSVYHKNEEKKRDLLVGTWVTEMAFPWGNVRMHVNLKPEGTFYVVADAASKTGQTAFGESAGNWEVVASSLKMNFTQQVPGMDMSQFYGGQIVALDEKNLSYKTRDGVESWKKVR